MSDAVSQHQVDQAQARAERAKAAIRTEQRALQIIDERRRELRTLIQTHRSTLSRRRFFDRTVTRHGGFVHVVTVSSFLAAVATGWVGLPWYVIVVAALAGASAAVRWGWRLLQPSDETLVSEIERSRVMLASLIEERRGTRLKVQKAEDASRIADSQYRELRDAFESRRNQLLSYSWQDLTGDGFEEFLKTVFLSLDYHVDRIGTTGDQGVDLLVSRDGRRIAIQAKGYPGSRVGNDAVQEAHTGRDFYGCHAAVVITNSTFTPAARRLAEGVGCMLIEKDQIPDLIRGRIRV